LDVKWRKSSTAGNEDGFCGLAGSQLVKFVLPPSKTVRFCLCQILKEQINRVLVFLVILQYLHGVEHFQQGGKVLLLHRGFIMQIGDQSGEQKTLAFLPEGVPAAAFALGVGHKGSDQFQNVFFAVDVAERVVVHGLFEVDGVQNFYLITIFQHGLPTFKHDCTFRIGYDIGTMALQEVRFQPKSRFTRAGAADHQHVFVPGVLGVRWTIAHH